MPEEYYIAKIDLDLHIIEGMRDNMQPDDVLKDRDEAIAIAEQYILLCRAYNVHSQLQAMIIKDLQNKNKSF